jgi:Skp family chaperone for outer membrane proteins
MFMFIIKSQNQKQRKVKMVQKKTGSAVNPAAKNYKKIGIIAAIVVVVAGLGLWGIRHFSGPISIDRAIADVSTEAVSGADLRIAIVRMDAIQGEAKVLADVRHQRESYETKLRDELTARQKDLEKEKTEIEKSQGVLSQEALQKRVVEYQQKVGKLQRDLTERAQSIDMAFQKTLNDIQEKHLDPIINAIIAKKNLSLVIDGRMARVADSMAPKLDITNDVVNSLNNRVSSVKMESPKGF